MKVLEPLPSRQTDNKIVHQQQPPPKPKASAIKASYNSIQSSGGRCVACKDNHLLCQCSAFQRLSVANRDSLLKSQGLCRNCFRSGHQAKDCQSKFSCRICKNRHHTLVCFKSEKDHTVTVAAIAGGNHSSNSKESQGSSGSNSIELANVAATDVSVYGQGDAKVKHTVQAVIRSRISDFSRDMRFLVLPKVTANLPTTSINTEEWILPNGIELADPGFFTYKEVDIVLSIEAFFEFFESGRRITIGKHLPSLTDSVFGWVVCGGCSTPINSLQVNCHFSTSEDLEKLMARFWSCEEVEGEELFQRGVQRGRHTVPLPKNEDVLPNLGESRDIAFRRLLGTERRLARDANLRDQYIGFMDEYLKLGHMRKVEETTEGPVKRCYLPHHPVVKEAGTTTKIREVFDASWPVVQEDLRSIILRSRMKQILLVSDVEKMFRQIHTWLKDRPLQSVVSSNTLAVLSQPVFPNQCWSWRIISTAEYRRRYTPLKKEILQSQQNLLKSQVKLLQKNRPLKKEVLQNQQNLLKSQVKLLQKNRPLRKEALQNQQNLLKYIGMSIISTHDAHMSSKITFKEVL
ncbi:uncharacterized protein LOC135697347 [Ochlerotatus camptorhynchus]|uniref:uncharacterized protein LOC135697347 n=1 Tax=Ochlerotatus camptorhynchus TaxID=644619 RepID=UPI0031E36575